MDSFILNKAGKTKKLEKFLELFPEDSRYEKLKSWIPTGSEIVEEEEPFVPKNGEILICGYPALAGSVLLTQYYEEELKKVFPMHFVRQTLDWERSIDNDKKTLEELVSSLKDVYVYQMGEGGLNKAMYQLGKDSGIGFTIFHEDIPVRQESIEVCEHFDLDPWSLFSSGSVLIVSEHSRELMERIKSLGIVVNRVGYMTAGKDKFISHKTINSRVNRPAPDGILKVLQSKLEIEKEA